MNIEQLHPRIRALQIKQEEVPQKQRQAEVEVEVSKVVDKDDLKEEKADEKAKLKKKLRNSIEKQLQLLWGLVQKQNALIIEFEGKIRKFGL
mmetsp:Transcript_6123/g.10398  ORF Transcript_6123/g.10398 Transcript_6123/m.10398 type:complete len:92 (+) Transcript_6123:131-406(+)